MNSYNPYGNTPTYQPQHFFPQPQGTVYLLNNSLEVANIPINAGLSIAICPSENTMYLKTLQNGAPTLMVYSIAPYGAQSQENPTASQDEYRAEMDEIKKQIEQLAKKIKGGNFDELI